MADFINDNSLLDSLSFSWSILKDNSFESLPGNGTSVTVNLNQTVASATVFLTISYRGRSSQSFIAIRWIEPYLKDIVHIYKYNGNMRCIYDALEFPLALYPASGKLILKENPDTWSPGIPYRLKMLGNYYLPTVVTYGGDDYYFFDLFNDMSFQTFFSGITESNSPQPLVIDIYNSQDDIVQTITYNISC